eukprot:4076338-Amphidinium_carterae.1
MEAREYGGVDSTRPTTQRVFEILACLGYRIRALAMSFGAGVGMPPHVDAGPLLATKARRSCRASGNGADTLWVHSRQAYSNMGPMPNGGPCSAS